MNVRLSKCLSACHYFEVIYVGKTDKTFLFDTRSEFLAEE